MRQGIRTQGRPNPMATRRFELRRASTSWLGATVSWRSRWSTLCKCKNWRSALCWLLGGVMARRGDDSDNSRKSDERHSINRALHISPLILRRVCECERIMLASPRRHAQSLRSPSVNLAVKSAEVFNLVNQLAHPCHRSAALAAYTYSQRLYTPALERTG